MRLETKNDTNKGTFMAYDLVVDYDIDQAIAKLNQQIDQLHKKSAIRTPMRLFLILLSIAIALWTLPIMIPQLQNSLLKEENRLLILGVMGVIVIIVRGWRVIPDESRDVRLNLDETEELLAYHMHDYYQQRTMIHLLQTQDCRVSIDHSCCTVTYRSSNGDEASYSLGGPVVKNYHYHVPPNTVQLQFTQDGSYNDFLGETTYTPHFVIKTASD